MLDGSIDEQVERLPNTTLVGCCGVVVLWCCGVGVVVLWYCGVVLLWWCLLLLTSRSRGPRFCKALHHHPSLSKRGDSKTVLLRV